LNWLIQIEPIEQIKPIKQMKRLRRADTRNLPYNTELMGRNTNEYNHNHIICNKKALNGDGSIMGCSSCGYRI
jgi:hypothetical protein